MKNILLFVFIITSANYISAQNPLVKQWDYRYGGTDYEYFTSFQQTTDGGYILGGRSFSGVSGDKTQPSQGGFDYWIVKTDSFGIKQWDKRFGGTDNEELNALQQTSDGGYILGGFSLSGIGGDRTQSSQGGDDYWIVKIDANGNKQWDKRFGGSDNDKLQTLKETDDGGFILGGFSYSGLGGDKTQPSWGGTDYWIVKIDMLGNKQWDKRFGGPVGDYLMSLQQTPDKGFILGGYSYSGISGDKTQSSQGMNDYWIVKIDSMGLKLWDKRFGGLNSDFLLSLKQTTDGGYILGGYSDSGISGDRTQSCQGVYDYWVVKVDASGNKLWDKRFGGNDVEWLYNIEQTSDAGYLLSGTSFSNISGDKTESNLGPLQTWIVKTDSVGTKQWDKTIFTIGADDWGQAIQLKDSCYVIANFSYSGVGGYQTQASWGYGDYWIIKFCEAFVPQTNLSSSDTSFCEKQCIDFTDLSTNNPTSWQWLFNGGTPDTSTMQNPTNICYNSYGNFDVTLIACNAAGCDTLTFYNFIHEFPNPVDSIWTDSINFQLISAPANSYQWYEVGSGLIAGETNQILIPPHAGNFYCVITDANGCIGTSNVIYTTAVESTIYDLGFTISPNPFTSNIAIDFQKQSRSFGIKEAIITIRDMIGRIVFQSEITNPKSEIPLSFLQSGMYMIEVIVDGKRIVKKIVKAP